MFTSQKRKKCTSMSSQLLLVKKHSKIDFKIRYHCTRFSSLFSFIMPNPVIHVIINYERNGHLYRLIITCY